LDAKKRERKCANEEEKEDGSVEVQEVADHKNI